jgi:phage gp29-like protein
MYLFKNYALKDWVAFAEVFGMPLRIGKYDARADKADKDALAAAIRSLGSDAAGIISKNTEIEFVETVKNSGTNNIYETLANFCDKQMSKAILGQTATTEGTPGKLGNEDAQDRVRHDLIKADAESLGKTIRHQIIRPLVGYNFGWDKRLPWFNLLYEKPEDLKNLMEVYNGAAKIGQPISAEHVSERFKIPLPKKGETVLEPRQGSLADGDVPLAAKARAHLNERPGTRVIIASGGEDAPEGEIDAEDRIVGRLSAEAGPITDEFVETIRCLVDDPSVKDLEDLRERLFDLWGAMDLAALGAAIARATAVAELAGMSEVQDETGA